MYPMSGTGGLLPGRYFQNSADKLPLVAIRNMGYQEAPGIIKKRVTNLDLVSVQSTYVQFLQ